MLKDNVAKLGSGPMLAAALVVGSGSLPSVVYHMVEPSVEFVTLNCAALFPEMKGLAVTHWNRAPTIGLFVRPEANPIAFTVTSDRALGKIEGGAKGLPF